jgi:hypothetical protein
MLIIYWPFGRAFAASQPAIADAIEWWMKVGTPPGRNIYLPTDAAGEHWVVTGSDK